MYETIIKASEFTTASTLPAAMNICDYCKLYVSPGVAKAWTVFIAFILV